ncbi:MAG: hypothetical protein M1150_00645 [Patescibacteria group bacterium]|nr:hypothetical protein [Patescibacteria group bacterium]
MALSWWEHFEQEFCPICSRAVISKDAKERCLKSEIRGREYPLGTKFRPKPRFRERLWNRFSRWVSEEAVFVVTEATYHHRVDEKSNESYHLRGYFLKEIGGETTFNPTVLGIEREWAVVEIPKEGCDAIEEKVLVA